jgi:hypothetical protein
VDPVSYPSTERTADLVLEQLGLARTPAKAGDAAFARTGSAEEKGFHLWSYEGRDTKAHCEHIRFIGPIVRDIVEPRWDTPSMDRAVPFTKAPVLGPAKPKADIQLSAAVDIESSPESGS